MSFSSQTKDELVESCKLGSTEEKRSLLCGITHAAGSMTLGRGDDRCDFCMKVVK